MIYQRHDEASEVRLGLPAKHLFSDSCFMTATSAERLTLTTRCSEQSLGATRLEIVWRVSRRQRAMRTYSTTPCDMCNAGVELTSLVAKLCADAGQWQSSTLAASIADVQTPNIYDVSRCSGWWAGATGS